MNTGGMFRGRARLVAGVLALTMAATAAIATPAVAASNTMLQKQVDYVLSSQTADGAITMTPSGRIVNPYFANTAAIGLLSVRTLDGRPGKAQQIDDAVARWMTWYVQHLNTTRSGSTLLSYSISDYTWDGAAWRQIVNSGHGTLYGDSVDSYSSTTLNLANAAWFSGSAALRDLVRANLTTYELIANTIVYPAPHGVRQADGLTSALPFFSGKYTMDNAEVYSGLVDFAEVVGDPAINQQSKSAYYDSFAQWTSRAMNDGLWNGSAGLWQVVSGQNASMTTFYPDGMAQLFPAMFEMKATTSAQGATLWQRFKDAFPQWSTPGALDPAGFPQVLVALAAARSGAPQDARTFIDALDQKYLANGGWVAGSGRPGYWYVAEAGHYLETVAELAARNV